MSLFSGWFSKSKQTDNAVSNYKPKQRETCWALKHCELDIDKQHAEYIASTYKDKDDFRQNYPHSPMLDKLIIQMCDDFDNESKDIEIVGGDKFAVILMYKKRLYVFWIANRWFAYLSYVYYTSEPVDDNWKTEYCDSHGSIITTRLNKFENFRPSHYTKCRFYNTFDHDAYNQREVRKQLRNFETMVNEVVSVQQAQSNTVHS